VSDRIGYNPVPWTLAPAQLRRRVVARLRRIADSDFIYDLTHTPSALFAAIAAVFFIAIALLAPVLAPHTPFDPITVSLADSLLPPAWIEGGTWSYPFGTDDQGRCVFSTILYGSRVSLFVGFASVAVAAALGVAVGLLCGWCGGWVDAVLMRLADIQLSLPDIMLALLISGIVRASLPRELQQSMAVWVLIVAIASANWPQYARVVRASTLAVRNREYVQAARVVGASPSRILIGHVLPNVLNPVVVISTVGLAFAILAEATLSFIGVGMPPTEPTLGALIRIGTSYLFSGEWWISVVPSLVLLSLALSVNVFGDWLRDALNPQRSK
jgi:peptide/nickel transport system permease protein